MTNTVKQTAADRIKLRMDELKIKQVDLIKSKVASKGSISLWLSGGALPSGDRLVNLAKELKVSTGWILSGENKNDGNFVNNLDVSPIALVNYAPVLSWPQVGNGINMEALDLEKCEMLPLVPGAGNRSFYLTVRGLSNAPHFEEGEKICIDPDYKLEDIETGEMVVVRCGDKATFKALIVEIDGYYLKLLNPDWQDQIIEFKDDCELVGKYVGSFKPAKKFML